MGLGGCLPLSWALQFRQVLTSSLVYPTDNFSFFCFFFFFHKVNLLWLGKLLAKCRGRYKVNLRILCKPWREGVCFWHRDLLHPGQSGLCLQSRIAGSALGLNNSPGASTLLDCLPKQKLLHSKATVWSPLQIPWQACKYLTGLFTAACMWKIFLRFFPQSAGGDGSFLLAEFRQSRRHPRRAAGWEQYAKLCSQVFPCRAFLSVVTDITAIIQCTLRGLSVLPSLDRWSVLMVEFLAALPRAATVEIL